MLRNSFFSTVSLPQTSQNINADHPVVFKVGIRINPDHPIFEGHFPEQPIVPGVTYIEMIREIMEMVLNKELQLKEGTNIKFLAITNPLINAYLDIEFSLIQKEENLITAKVLITSENNPVIKFEGKFSNK